MAEEPDNTGLVTSPNVRGMAKEPYSTRKTKEEVKHRTLLFTGPVTGPDVGGDPESRWSVEKLMGTSARLRVFASARLYGTHQPGDPTNPLASQA